MLSPSAAVQMCACAAGGCGAAGMDPISRRAVWDAISAAKQHAALVLTTHSMEEADALGDRIGIMVRGRMRVLGGSLSLKQKYGNGYQVIHNNHSIGLDNMCVAVQTQPWHRLLQQANVGSQCKPQHDYSASCRVLGFF